MGKREWVYQIAAAFLFLAVLFIVGANVEIGINDDWSYIQTVKDLAHTGHLIYNGWAAPLIGFQAYWGALFVRLFGFSFFVVRASSWFLLLLSIPVLWRLLRSIEISPAQSFFGLTSFLLSPLILPNLVTFMTDLPAFELCATSLLCALNAWKSKSDKTARAWICALTIMSLLSGSVRQIYWLSGICFLVILGIFRMRSLPDRIFVAICATITVILGALASSWLGHQPYVPAELTLEAWHKAPWETIRQTSFGDTSRDLMALSLVCVPFSAMLVISEIRRYAVWINLLIIAGAVAITFFLADPVPWLGNTLSEFGVIMDGTVVLGHKPQILSTPMQVALGSIALACAVYALLTFIQRLKTTSLSTGLGRFIALTMPFLLSYLLVLAVRAPGFGLFDRYIIPHLFVAMSILLAMNTKPSRSSIPIGRCLGAIFILYGIATTHDFLSETRAKLQAQNAILHAGVNRASILGGFEFDSQTQIELAGHVNNDQVHFPRDGYHQVDDCSGIDDLQAWWRTLAPNLDARYAVTLSHMDTLVPSPFAPVEYWRWLPLQRSYVLVEMVAPSDPPLTCKPEILGHQ